MSQGRGRDSSRRKRDGSILKNSRERRASAVRERIGPCVIVLYKPANGHRLHRMRKDSDCRVVDPGRGTEQDDSILCTELRRPPFCHGLLPSASSWRMRPSPPRASARSRASAYGPHDSRTPASTARMSRPVWRLPYGNRTLCCRSHGLLLVLAPLANLSLAGQEHGRTIRLTDIAPSSATAFDPIRWRPPGTLVAKLKRLQLNCEHRAGQRLNPPGLITYDEPSSTTPSHGAPMLN